MPFGWSEVPVATAATVVSTKTIGKTKALSALARYQRSAIRYETISDHDKKAHISCVPTIGQRSARTPLTISQTVCKPKATHSETLARRCSTGRLVVSE